MISIHPPVSAGWRRGSSSRVYDHTGGGREELQEVKTVGRVNPVTRVSDIHISDISYMSGGRVDLIKTKTISLLPPAT